MSALLTRYWPVIVIGIVVVCSLRGFRIARLVARRAFERGDVDRAIAIAARSARLRPRDPQAWLLWTRLVKEAGGPWGPAAVVEQGLEHNPGSLELAVELARTLMSEGRDREARGLLVRLQEEHPAASAPPLLLAWQAVTARNWPHALELCSTAQRRLDPQKDAAETLELGHVLLLIPGQRAQAAEVIATAADHSETPAAHLYMAALTEATDPQEARRHLAHARYYCDVDRERLREAYEEVRQIVGAATAAPKPSPVPARAEREVASRAPSAREWFQGAALRFVTAIWTLLLTIASLAYPWPPLIALWLGAVAATVCLFSRRYLAAAAMLGLVGAGTAFYTTFAGSVGDYVAFAVPPLFLACATAELWFRQRRRRGPSRPFAVVPSSE